MAGEAFDNDPASRYAERRPSATGEGWRAREANIASQITGDPGDSVASMVWNFDRVYTSALTGLVKARKYGEAKAYRDKMVAAVEANRDDIHRISMVGDVGGETSKELARRAQSVFEYGFDSAKVDMPDGSSATIGDILSEGSPYLQAKSNDLANMGFGSGVAQLYFNGDDRQRRVLSRVVDPLVAQAPGRDGTPGALRVPNRAQLTRLGNDLVSNWDRFSAAFGDGLFRVVDDIATSHATAGNMSEVLRTLTLAAEASGMRPGDDLADHVTRGYRNLLNATCVGDRQKNGLPPAVSDNDRGMFDAAFVPAVRAMVERTGGFSFDSPALAQALREVKDLDAYLGAAGADLMSEARDNSCDINRMFGEYCADAATGVRSQSSNVVAALRTMRQELNANLTGGRSPALVKAELTGRDEDYVENVDRSNATKSLNPVADGMADSAKKYLVRTLLPRIAGGRRADDAIDDILADDDAREAFVGGLAATLSDSLHGRGRERAAAKLAEAIVAGVRTGRPVNVEDFMAGLAVDPGFAAKDPDAAEVAKMWYNGTVASEALFGTSRARLIEHFRASGFTDAKARAIASRVISRMAKDKELGGNPLATERSALNTGRALIPIVDEKGNPVLDEYGVPRIESHVGRLDQASFSYDGEVIAPNAYNDDPVMWDNMQKLLEEHKGAFDRRRESIVRNLQALQGKKEMADYMDKLKAERKRIEQQNEGL